MTAPEGIRISKRWVTVGIILAELVLLYLLLDGGGWVFDDNLAMILAGRSGLNWSWLTAIFFQHWGIGYHFVYSVLHDLMPIDYRWALIVMLGLLGGSMYLLQRIISLLFGAGWVAVIAAAVYGSSSPRAPSRAACCSSRSPPSWSCTWRWCASCSSPRTSVRGRC
jgi:hypothetical protein